MQLGQARYPPGLDMRAASEAARLAQLTYVCGDAESSAAMSRLGYELQATVRGPGGTLVLVGRRDSQIAVAFRGTANAENVALDLDFRLAPLRLCGPGQLPAGCAVHCGFGRGYAALAPELLRELRAITRRHPGGAAAMRVCATGHSFGGALAALLLLQLALDAECAPPEAAPPGAGAAAAGAEAAEAEALRFGGLLGFTFGLGRLGNDEFAAAFRQALSRTAAAADPPAQRPLRAWQPPSAWLQRARLLSTGPPPSPPRPAFALWSLSLADDPLASLPPRLLGFTDHNTRHLLLNATRAAQATDGAGAGLGAGVHPLPLDELQPRPPDQAAAPGAQQTAKAPPDAPTEAERGAQAAGGEPQWLPWRPRTAAAAEPSAAGAAAAAPAPAASAEQGAQAAGAEPQWLPWRPRADGNAAAAAVAEAAAAAAAAAAVLADAAAAGATASAATDRAQWQSQLGERAAAWQANLARMSALAWQEVAQVAAGQMDLHFIASYCAALDELAELHAAQADAAARKPAARHRLGARARARIAKARERLTRSSS